MGMETNRSDIILQLPNYLRFLYILKNKIIIFLTVFKLTAHKTLNKVKNIIILFFNIYKKRK